MKRKKGAFVAKRHLCWFSRKPEYRKMEVEEVFQKDPAYILWCFENLTWLRFATGLSNRIKKYKKLNSDQNDERSVTTEAK